MSTARSLVTDPQALVRQSFNAQANSKSTEAISLMEGALWFAEGNEAEQIRDTLAALYIAENDTPRLVRVLGSLDGELSAELVKAALALLRNQAMGTLDELPPQCERAIVLQRMRECFDVGAYDIGSAMFILSMLLQIRETDLALELTHSLFDAQCRIDESVLAKMLAALLDASRFGDAKNLLQKAATITRLSARTHARLAMLIGMAAGDRDSNAKDIYAADIADDKVVQFVGWRFQDKEMAEKS